MRPSGCAFILPLSKKQHTHFVASDVSAGTLIRNQGQIHELS